MSALISLQTAITEPTVMLMCHVTCGNLGNCNHVDLEGLAVLPRHTRRRSTGGCATANNIPMLCHRSACCRHSMAAATHSPVYSLGHTRTRSVPSVTAQRRNTTARVKGRDAKGPTITAAPHKIKRKQTAPRPRQTSDWSPNFPPYYDVLAALAIAYCFYSNIRFALSY